MPLEDRSARYSAFFRAHHGAVRRYVARRAAPEIVDDIVSETFLAAWRRFEAIPADGLPWLLGTASKCLANQRRGALRGTELIARLGAERRPAAPDEHEAAHRRRALVRAFARLPDGDRELMMLTIWDGLSSGRAGAVLGLAPATAHVRVYRARKRLRQALAAELDDDGTQPVPRSAHESA